MPSAEKSVKFDLNPQEEPSKESSAKHENQEGGDEYEHDEDDHGRRRHHDHHHHHHKDNEGRSNGKRGSGRGRDRDKDRERHGRNDSPASDASDTTIELPPRFDEHGRRRAEDPLADKLETVLQSLFR